MDHVRELLRAVPVCEEASVIGFSACKALLES